jgi:hypothetical protein
MRTIARALAVAVLLAGSALGLASPASADQVMEGVYTYNEPGMPAATWTIFPICVNVVGDLREPLYLPVACTLNVTSATNDSTTHALAAQNFGGSARLTGFQWTFTTTKREGLECPDGSKAPTTETYAFNDATLTGTHTISHNEVCGLRPGLTKVPFTLKFEKPPPIPIQRYPLQCEPGGLRLCR